MTAAVVLLALVAAPDFVLPTPATSFEQAQRTWSGGRAVSLTQPQGFRLAVLDTALLAELNRYRWAPKRRDGSFDPAALARCWVGPGFVLAYDGQRRLRFALLRYAVPVDGGADPAGGWSAERLRPLRRVVAALGRQLGLRPAVRDRYGNVFGWTGGSQRMQSRLRYLPEGDELRLLLRF